MAFDLGPEAKGLAKIFCYVRGAFVSLFLILWTAICASLVVFLGTVVGHKNLKYGTDLGTRTWARVLIFLFGIKLDVRGFENIPKEGVLFLFNHTSNFDIMVLLEVLGQKKIARFGAKTELFKIPIFGRAMTAAGALQIHRADRERVLDLYRESITRVEAGESFILAAEGTRLPHPGVGEKFKSGPFIFAITGQFPIVPVVIRGAAEVQPKNDLIANKDRLVSHIRVTFLPPVPTKGLTLDDRPRLSEQLQVQMTKTYNAD